MKKYVFGFLIIVAGVFSFNSAEASPQYEYKRVLEHGSSGIDVVYAQHCLARIVDLPHDGIDDYFSSRIKSRVIKVQKEFGLKTDGVIGKKTGALMEKKCPQTGSQKATKNSHAKIDIEVESDKDSAEIEIDFKLKNTSSKDITLFGRSGFDFVVNGKKMNGSELSQMDGFSLSIKDQDRDNVARGYTIDPKEKVEISVSIDIDANEIDDEDLADFYNITLAGLDWKLGDKDKYLKLGAGTGKIEFK